MDMRIEEERLGFAEELEEAALQLFQINLSLTETERLQLADEEYGRLQATAAMLGWPELSALISSRRKLFKHTDSARLLAEGCLSNWLELTALVLRDSGDAEHLPLLSAALSDDAWPEALSMPILQDFLLSLRLPADEIDSSDAVQTVATLQTDAADNQETQETQTVLQFADDIHPELLAAYLEETPGHITEAAHLIRLLAKGSLAPEQKNQASRLLHTLKGSSGVVGAEALAVFAHDLEDLLAYPLQLVPEGLSALLESSADCLESLFEHLQAKLPLPAVYWPLRHELQQWHQRLSEQQEVEVPPVAMKAPLSLQQLTGLLEKVGHHADESDEFTADQAVTQAFAAPLSQGVTESRMRHLLNLTGELIASMSQTAELLNQGLQLGRQLYRQDEQVRSRLDELEALLEQQNAPSQRQRQLDTTTFDALEMDSYNDVQSTVSLLAESMTDSREMAANLQQCVQQMRDEFYQQQRVQRQLSEAILGMRMMPVSTLIPRLERIVRETCRVTGKKAEITVEGQQLQVDSDILKGITDPLLHLLRNAVDHGIETPAVRLEQGKAETGIISLKFSHLGNYIQLSLQDDGAGMDNTLIRQRAIACGLIQEEAELDDSALLRLTLQPGFSTRDHVNAVSGRGVGMDVVQAAVSRLRGHLAISSQAGQGSCFTIELPQTLMATHALVVRAAGQLLAIPADRIEQLLYVSADQQILDEQGWRIETERYQLPIMQLAHVLQWVGQPIEEVKDCTFLIVRHEPQPYAFYVEDILPSRDIVIKTLAPWLDYIPGLQGACVLVNGKVAPVLDMVRLLQDMDSGELVPFDAQDDHNALLARERPNVATLLVVDDSLSNRKSMRLMLEGMGYAVHTAVDGLDALQVLNHTAMDMVLTDLEMPRMNGLEMTQAIRIWPERKHLPVLMITSRSTRKHREQAAQVGVDGYLTKPVQLSELQAHLQKWLLRAPTTFT